MGNFRSHLGGFIKRTLTNLVDGVDRGKCQITNKIPGTGFWINCKACWEDNQMVNSEQPQVRFKSSIFLLEHFSDLLDKDGQA